MQRVLIIGGDSHSSLARQLAHLLVQHDIEVLDAQSIEAQTRQPDVFELKACEVLDLKMPARMLADARAPRHFQDERRQSKFLQSAKQQSFRAKARR